MIRQLRDFLSSAALQAWFEDDRLSAYVKKTVVRINEEPHPVLVIETYWCKSPSNWIDFIDAAKHYNPYEVTYLLNSQDTDWLLRNGWHSTGVTFHEGT